MSTPTPSASGESSPNYRSPIPSPTPPTLSPQTNRMGGNSPEMRCHSPDSQSVKDLDLEENIDPSIPDASNWTYEEVYDYFAQYFPEEAKVFKEQVRFLFLVCVFQLVSCYRCCRKSMGIHCCS